MAQYDGSIRINTKINEKGISKGVSQIKNALKGIGSSAKSAKDSFNSFTIGAGNSAEKLTATVKKLGIAIAGAFAGRKIIDFGKSAIQAAADMEAMDSQFSQVFGNFEEQASASLSRIADQAGILEERMKGSYTKIAAFAKTTGMDTTSSLELANRAMVAVADSAAFYDRSLEETTESLQSFLKGNYENDAALGLSATETTRNAAANKLYGKSFIELSEAQKQLTLLQMVEDANKLSGALGQASREADTWTNQTGNLNQALNNLKANIGKFVLPLAVQTVKMITNIINSINALLSKLYTVSGAFRSFSELITGNKSDAGNGFSGIMSEDSAVGYDDAANAAENLADANEDVADSTKKAAKAAKGQLSTLDRLNNLTTKENDSANAGNDYGIVSGGVIPMQEVDYGKLAEGENFADKLADSLKNVWNVFKEAWDSKGSGVISSAKNAFTSLMDLAKTVGETVYSVFTSEIGVSWVESILGRLQSVLDIIGSISDAFSSAWKSGEGEKNISALFDMLTNINNLISSVRTSFSTAFSSGKGEEIIKKILSSLTGVYNTVGNLAKKIQEAWDTAGLGDSIWGGILDIVDSIFGTIDRIANSTAEWAENLDFTPLLESIDKLLTALEPLAENIGEGLEWFWNNVLLPVAGWVIEDAVPTFLDMLSTAIDALNKVIDALKPLGQWLWDNFLEPLGRWAGEVVISAMQTITDLLEKFGNWVAEHQEAVQNMAIIVASFFAAFKITTAIKGIVDFVGKIKGLITTVGGMSKLITSVFNPWTLAIGGVIAAGILLYKNWDVIKEKAAQLKEWLIKKWEEIKQKAKEIWEGIKNTISSIVNAIKTVISTIWNAIKSVTSSIWNGIKSVISGAINGVKNTISSVLNTIKGIWDRIWGGLFSKVSNILGGIKDAVGKAFDWIADKVTWILEKLGLVSTKTEIVKGSTAGGFGQSIRSNPSIQSIDIPGYATGQVIPRTMRQHLAVLGDNSKETEVVSPLSTIKKALREEVISLGLLNGKSDGVREVTIHVPLEVDGRTIFEIIRKIDLEEFERTKRPSFQI